MSSLLQFCGRETVCRIWGGHVPKKIITKTKAAQKITNEPQKFAPVPANQQQFNKQSDNTPTILRLLECQGGKMHIQNLTSLVFAAAAILAVFAGSRAFGRIMTAAEERRLRGVLRDFYLARRVLKWVRPGIPSPHAAILGTCANFGLQPEFCSSLGELGAIRLTPDMVKRPAADASGRAVA